MDKSLIFALTQSILAIVIVVGGGVLMTTSSVPAEVIVGVVGVVVGYFFGSTVNGAPKPPSGSASQ